jgi:signal transduction histidine kinase
MPPEQNVTQGERLPTPTSTVTDGTTTKGPPRPAVLWAVALAGLAASAGTVLLASENDEIYQRSLRLVLINWATLPFIFAGLVAWRRRPDTRFGPLMIAAGFATPLSTLQWAEHPLPNTVGQLCDLLLPALWLHVFLAYPTGRLRGRPARVLVVGGYAVALGLQVVVLALGGFGPPSLLAVTSEPALAEVVQNLQLVVLAMLCLAGLAVIWSRRRTLPPAQRNRPTQLLIDSFALALAIVAALLLSGAFELPGFELNRLAAFAAVGLSPVVFLAGLLDARLARAGVGRLLVDLQADSSPDLRELLARTLRDPTLTLAYWLPQYGSWSDQDGNPVTLPGPGEDHGVRVIESDGEPIAALLFDVSLRGEPELLAAASAAAAMALHKGRLEAELKARLAELQGSRTRLVEATQRERERLERDLHDGAQQRLAALALELGVLSHRMNADTEVRARIDRARGEVTESLEELRDLAHGIHPAVVSGHGLTVALESLAARSSVPLTLESPILPRLPESVEVAGYYVVCESLANIAKHSRAHRADVRAAVRDGVLVVQVEDDGVGGADPENGSGLRGLADRVEALGGQLRIWSSASSGTRVQAEIPCE